MPKFEKRKLSKDDAEKMGVTKWGIWKKEVSKFDWEYDTMEKFYVLEGEAEIDAGDEKITFGPGDFVTCYPGVKCKWMVKKPIKKHYHFG